jgi:hypothetical protein
MKARPHLNVQVLEDTIPGDVVRVENINTLDKNTTPRYLPVELVGGVTPTSYPPDPPEDLTGTGALATISLTSAVTEISTTGVATTTLAEGTKKGQVKKNRMKAFVGAVTITVAGTGVTSIVMDAVDDTCTLQWDGTGWLLIDNQGCVVT